MKKAKVIISILIALVTVGALTACGGGKEPVGSGSSSSQQGGVNTGREASNSVIVGMPQELDSLDPHSAEGAGTREILFNLFEGLVKATPDGELEPAVASAYSMDDPTKIVFTLRDGIKFSDGSDVTAEDVKYSIERYADIQGKESAFSNLKDIVVADNGTIEILLNEPNSDFIYELTCAIIPKANDANVATAPVGTGPFKFVSYTPGESLVVAKNENYWKEGRPYLDEVTFKLVEDTDTAVSMLKAGSLDVYHHLTVDQASTLGDSFNILEGNENMVQAVFLNNGVAPFNDIRVRQAICYAIDRDMVNQMVFDGKSHLIGTNMIPSNATYYNADTEHVYDRDVAKAKELLAEAGQSNLTFTIRVPGDYQPHVDTAQIVKENLAEAGITANIELVEWTTWLDDVYNGRNYQATIIAVDNRFLAPSTWMTKNISTGANNFTNYSNPEFDETYQKALKETDQDTKVKLYYKLQEILTNDAASAYIEDPAMLVAVNSDLEGYTFYPISAQDMSLVKYK